MSDTNAQLKAEQEAHDAMWREIEEANKTSNEPMSRARFDELMSLDIDLDSLPDISEPFDLSAKFDLEQEIKDRNVNASDKIPGLVTIDGIIDLAIPVGYFTPACWASDEMGAWLQKFANKVSHIHKGNMPEFKGRTIGELVEFAITYNRPKVPEQMPDVAFNRLGWKGKEGWYELEDQTMAQDKAIWYGIFYETNKKELYQVNSDDNWMPITETQAKRFLQIRKGQTTTKDEEGISNLDKALFTIFTSINVDYAGPVAGWKKGAYYAASGQRMLVTVSPNIIEPRQGSWDTIRRLVSEQLGEEQVTYFFGWLKMAYESLQGSTLMPGQVLVLAGPKDCGKTFLQEYVITPIIGGRSANPYSYMVGKTDFNSELCKAEHLMMSDDSPPTDNASRRNFGSEIKKLLVTPTQRLHAKGKDAVTVKPFWRFSISVNDEPEYLMMLPPLDDSMLDKLMLLHVGRPECLPQTVGERPLFLSKIREELPAFIWFLVNKFSIPEHLISGRFGITHYHNPTLAESIIELSNERHLLQLIDEHIFGIPGRDEWKGTASDLLRALAEVSPIVANEVKKYTSKSCGINLRRLEKSTAPSIKGRVKSRTKDGRSLYIILPPSSDNDPYEE